MTLTVYFLISNGWIGEYMGGFGAMESFCLCFVCMYVCEVCFSWGPLENEMSHLKGFSSQQ